MTGTGDARSSLRRTVALGALAILGLSACAGGHPGRTELLPFHVRVAPVEVRTIPIEDRAAATEWVLKESLVLDRDELGKAIVEALDGQVFTAATLLGPAGGRPEPDLLLRVAVEYSPRIDMRFNMLWWFNVFLAFLGPWWCYLTEDVLYTIEVEARANLYDLRLGAGAEGGDGGKERLVPEIFGRVQQISLNFVARNDRLWRYPLSFLLPSGLWAWETPRVKLLLQVAAIRKIVEEISSQLSRRQRQILDPRSPAFSGRPDEVRIFREGRGTAMFAAKIKIPDTSAPGLYWYSLDAGGTVAGGSLEEGRTDPASVERIEEPPGPAFRIRRVVDVPPESRLLRLTVWEADRDLTSRSFTFPIEPARAGAP